MKSYKINKTQFSSWTGSANWEEEAALMSLKEIRLDCMMISYLKNEDQQNLCVNQ